MMTNYILAARHPSSSSSVLLSLWIQHSHWTTKGTRTAAAAATATATATAAATATATATTPIIHNYGRRGHCSEDDASGFCDGALLRGRRLWILRRVSRALEYADPETRQPRVMAGLSVRIDCRRESLTKYFGFSHPSPLLDGFVAPFLLGVNSCIEERPLGNGENIRVNGMLLEEKQTDAIHLQEISLPCQKRCRN
ncbi:hypothetical protein Pelo_7063 [Pelomyxa schiedti]|nr:hypothetical protein Pelo_7063 [Pelomyxa schiedti]